MIENSFGFFNAEHTNVLIVLLLFSLFFGLNGIWSGMALGNMLAALLSYGWSARTLKQLAA